VSGLDWLVLGASLVFIVAYGVWKGRGSHDLDGYLLADRSMRWYTVALSIMATQASAITFLSTPGQAYADGMRFVQFYFGLPLAMVVLSITAVPIYRRLNVYTAYEYLEARFDAKTRVLAATLFLIQRGLAAGLTIYAPALVLSTLLGWPIDTTNLLIGGLVIVYTASGGTRAVNWTQFHQMIIILAGMAAACAVVLHRMPAEVSLLDAVRVAGKAGKLNAIDLSFDLTNRYTLWSGLLGGFFLALSYFGTDQSQVRSYLSGRSVAESRLALLTNGLLKVPMQCFILFVGTMVFVFYLFEPPPLHFHPATVRAARAGPAALRFAALETRHHGAAIERRARALALVDAFHSGEDRRIAAATADLGGVQREIETLRGEALTLVAADNPAAERSDTNYVFLSFVVRYLPAGLVGLVLAAIFAASMSSTSAELNALASTTVVDVYQRFLRPGASPGHLLAVSRAATVLWGGFAILFASYASRLGSLIEAVNILGSLVYGTILGIFLTAFYLPRVGGTAVFAGAMVAEAVVLALFRWSPISFLWYNVAGCLVVVAVAAVLSAATARATTPGATSPSTRR
jgi:Na+/proline symporter